MDKLIAYREGSCAAFIDMAAAPGTVENRKLEEPAPPLDYSSYAWSPWGKNNLFPQEMVQDIETCGILNAIIDGKARFALNEGIVPAIVERDKNGTRVVKEWVNDPEITAFLKNNNHFYQCFNWFRDLFGLGNAAMQLILNREKTRAVKFKRIDISELRFEKKDKNGVIKKVYLSANWKVVPAQTTSTDPVGVPGVISPDTKTNLVKDLPLLDHNNPVEDLREKAASGITEHVMTVRYPSWGKHYYSVPLWYAAYKWVKIAQGVPEMKAALFQNTMRLKYMVIIYPKYWEDAFPGQWDKFTPEEKEKKRNKLFDEINDYLIGAKNAHKSLFVDGQYDPVGGKFYSNIDIKPIEDTTKAGEYLPDSAAANSEIAFSMLWNNALTGGNQASGLYEQSQGGSNVRESYLMQVLIHVFERELINHLLWPVIAFNGWDQKYPGLEFIIPATILTTTDTGGSTKATLNNKNKQDGAAQDH